MSAKLHAWFPRTTTPFICNAPMFGFANSKLAASVTEAGGFGFIGGGLDFTATSSHIATLRSELSSARKLLEIESHKTDFPIGIGFLMFRPDNFLQAVVPVLREYCPAAVWLFAAESRAGYADVIPTLKAEGKSWGLKIFVQVGSVQGAREAVEDGTDVLVVQGTDAGGHQMTHGASLLTLLPEVVDMLNDEFSHSHVSVIAAGGIMDGRGIAAAQALGAYGVVMGTRFVVTKECPSPVHVKSTMIMTTDGSQSTIKSTVHDDIQGTDFWPADMDGRAIIGDSYKDFLSGLPKIENEAKYQEASKIGDTSRKIIWSGSGVGLIKSVLTAEEVVKGSQIESQKIIKAMANL